MSHPALRTLVRGLALGWGDDLILAAASAALTHPDACKEQS